MKKTLGIILICAVICLAYFWSLLSLTRQMERKAVLDQQAIIAANLLEDLDSFIYHNMLNIQLIAQNDAFAQYFAGKLDADSAHDALQRMSLQTGPWYAIAIFDLQGKVVLSTSTKLQNRNIENSGLEEQRAYTFALSNQLTTSDLYYSPVIDKPVMIVSAPISLAIKGSGSKVVGVMMGYLAWPTVNKIIGDVQIPAALLNSKSEVIASTQTPRQNESSPRWSLLSLQRVFRDESFSEVLSPKQTIFGEEAYVSGATERGYLRFHGHGWVIILEQPLSLVFGSGNQQVIKYTFGLVGFAVFVMFVVIVVAVVLHWKNRT